MKKLLQNVQTGSLCRGYSIETDLKRMEATESLKNLKESIKTNGIQCPLIVNAVNGEYQLVSGRLRLLAAVSLGIGEIPCYVFNNKGKYSGYKLAYLSNWQRLGLNPISIGTDCKDFLYGPKPFFTKEELAKYIDIASTRINYCCLMIELPKLTQELIREQVISYEQAIELTRLIRRKKALTKQTINSIALRLVKEKITVRELKQIVSDSLASKI